MDFKKSESMTNLDNKQRFLPPQPPPDDDGNLPCREPSDAHTPEDGYDWAGNSVPWNPELPVFEPSHNPLPEADSWNVPYSDFTPPASPFVLEMRAETIEQLVGGDALRRGESERIEAGRSKTNADLVAGRDRVRVQGTLHEHTGHGLVEQAAHLDTAVDARLDVDAGSEDTVLLAGHMKDVWDGGTAIVAAVTDELVAGGGVRVTAPLDLWMHGLMGVEERIGTCTADAVLLEMSGTHYEREYGPGAHVAGLASYTGSLYQSNRSTFRPLMRVSSGVRNLIPGGGGGGAGGTPDASPPPAPAPGSAGTEAVSETLSTATGSARSEAVAVNAGARSDDLTGVRHFPDTTDTVHTDEFTTRGHHAVSGQLDTLMEEILRWGDESEDLTEATRSTDTAERLATLQRAEFAEIDSLMHAINQQVLEIEESVPPHTLGVADSVAPASPGGTDDLHHAREPHDAHSPVPGSHEADLDSSRFEGYELPDMEEPLNPADARVETYIRSLTDQHWSDRQSDEADLDLSRFEGYELPDIEGPHDPADSSWATNLRALTDQLQRHRIDTNWVGIYEYEPAVTRIVDEVTSAYSRLGGNVDDLVPSSDEFVRAHEAYRGLEGLLLKAELERDLRRIADIQRAMDEINLHTYEVVVDLASRQQDVSVELFPKLAPNIDSTKLQGWVHQQIDIAINDAAKASLLDDVEDMRLARAELEFWQDVRHEIISGRDPTVNSGARIVYLRRIGQLVEADMHALYHASLRDIMGDTAMLRPGAAVGTASFPGSLVSDPFAEATVSRRSEVVHLTASEIDFITRPTGDGIGSGLSAATDRYEILDPNVHADRLRMWAKDQLDYGMFKLEDPNLQSDPNAVVRLIAELEFYRAVRGEAAEGHDPAFWGHNLMTQLFEGGDTEATQQIADLQMGLHDAMSDPWIRTPTAPVGDSLSRGRADAPTGAAPESSPPDLNVPTTEPEFRFGPGDSGPGSDGAVPQLTPDGATWQVEPGASRPPDTDIGYSSIQWDSGRVPTDAEGSRSTTSLGSTHGALLPETGAGTPLPTDSELRRRPAGMQSPLHEASFGGAQAAETPGLQDLGGQPPGWQADETPGFGRVAADSDNFDYSRREQIVNSLKRGDLMSDSLFTRLANRYADATIQGEIDLAGWGWKELAELIGDLARIADDARRAGSSTADYSAINYPALYLLLSMLETPSVLS